MTARADLRDARCADCGARCNAGWLRKVLTWDWHEIAMDGYPGWDSSDDDAPPAVELVLRCELDKSSTDIDREWDDVAKGRFYSRDFSPDGSVFVRKGEAYRSRWWFEKRADAYAFALKYAGASGAAARKAAGT